VKIQHPDAPASARSLLRSILRLSSLPLLFTASHLCAQTTIEWSGAGAANNYWSTPGNWLGDTLPSDTDDVLITSTASATLTVGLNGTQAYANSLTVDTTAGSVILSGAGAINLTSGNLKKVSTTNALNISSNIVLGASGAWSNLSTSGTSAFNITGVISDNGNGHGITWERGILTLSGANTFSGGFILKSGTLHIRNSQALGTGAFTLEGSGVVTRFTASGIIGNAIMFNGAGRNDWYLDSATGFNREITFGNSITGAGATSGGQLQFFGSSGVWRFKETISLTNVTNTALTLKGQQSAGVSTYIFSKNVTLSQTSGASSGITLGETSTDPTKSGSASLLIDQAIRFDGMGHITDASGAGVNTIGGIHESGTAVIAPTNGITLQNQMENATNLVSRNADAVTGFATQIKQSGTNPVAVRVNDNYRQIDTTQTTGSTEVFETITPEGIVDLTHAAGNTWQGGTTVLAGGLRVNNSSNSGTGAGAVTVKSGAFLGGAGIIAPGDANGVVIESGGILAPGNDNTGTLRLNGTNTTGALLTLENGARLVFRLGADGAGDSIDLLGYAPGDLVLSGNTVDFVDAGGLSAGQVYTLFRFYSDATGASIVASGIADGLVIGTGLDVFAGSHIRYGTHSIELVVGGTPIPEPSAWMLVSVAGLVVTILRIRLRGAAAS
jgi:autotransporter-associated beta strand protein